MTWNYRVMRHEAKFGEDTETAYAIHEVYYNDDGTVSGWTERPANVTSDSEDFEVVFLKLQAACKKPTLDYKTGKEIDSS